MRVSVVTVCFNSSDTIVDCLNSVANQSYDDVEHILVDGLSSDDTLSLIELFAISQSKVISESDSGIYDAMNKGVQLATGDIICILNSDDFYLHDHVLSDVVSFFSSDNDLEVLLGGVDFVDSCALSTPVRCFRSTNFKPWMFNFGFMPPHPSVFVRKTAYQRIGLYKVGYKLAADFDFLTRLLLVGSAKYVISHDIFVRMRTGGASTSGLESNIISTREIKRSLRENGLFASNLVLLLRLPLKFLSQVLFK